jgi:class 3 adenylate cyclase/tetratricopeptide (TPR) repeat protein
MERCRQCGAAVEAGYRFCGECGSAVGGCPSCGQPLIPGKRFCVSCGQPLSAARPASPAPAAGAGLGGAAGVPVAERRVCSVLFCDVVGFTPLSEARDPEAIRELLSRYFGVARTVIGRYGGVVEKFIGDAVMAVWGTPVAAEGDAERAVRAALDLVTAVAALGAEVRVPGLAVRAGVVTGEVAVTLGAVGEGMVAGDAVNTASRVQSGAEPGTVLADEATHLLTASAVAFADAGEHLLKGKAGPQRLWRAVRVVSAMGGAQRIDGLEGPLAGRDAELRTVKELFHASADRRVPRMVVVSGPAGVGKSRLGWEFEKYADGLAGDVWWHRGRCLSYGDGVAFWALAQIFRQRLGIAEDDPADEAARKLAEGLDRYVPDPAERPYIGARLARLLGVGFAGDGGGPLAREELFAGWRLFLERLAADGPVVLLVEDAQYADAGLLDFLDYLTDWVRGLPVFILVLARPELGTARPGFGAGRNRVTLTLDPLDAASMDALVDALVPGMPTVARAAVTGQAQGLPLFAVEVIRSLIDRDVVRPIDGAYRLVSDIGELQVPGSLHALLAARLDALDPASRRLAGDAAVLGATFTADALTAVSGQDTAAVRGALADLVRREVLVISADPLSPERGSYGFAQDMLRQVAYETLSRRDRKARHLAVAAHLRAAFPEDGEQAADVIASHYLDALHAVPDDPDTAAIRGQAIGMLVRAGQRAERTGAPAAASYAAAALAAEEAGLPAWEAERPGGVVGQDARGADAAEPGWRPAGFLWEMAAQAAYTSGDYPAAVEHAGRAREDHLRHGRDRDAARAQAVAGPALREWGRLGEARDQLTAALAVLRDDPDADTVRALGELAAVEVYAGAPAADALTTEALALGQAHAVDDATLASLFITRGICLGLMSRRAEATSYFREAARLAGQVGNSMLLGRALLNLSDAVNSIDPASGAVAARDATASARQVGARGYLAAAIMNLAQALLMLGDWDAAAAELEQGTDADGLADVEYLACFLACAVALRGDVPAAEAALAGLGGLRASEAPQDQALIALTEAFTAAARCQPVAALSHARAVLGHTAALGTSSDYVRWAWPLAARAAWDLADTQAGADLLELLDGYRPGELAPMVRAERDLARARLATIDANQDAAGTALAVAVAGLRQQSTPYHLAHGLLDHAAWLIAQGDTDSAADAVAEATAIAARLGCQPLLDRAASIAPATAPVVD